MNAADLRRLRMQNPSRALLEKTGWYHSFQFQDGTEIRGAIPVEVLKDRYQQLALPEDLTGKRVLDIGAWDGWFSFETERHGAEVTAIDAVEMPNFLHVHRKLGSQITYLELDLFEIPQAALGKFDYVLFLGVLYHTKYPVLALEIICGLTREMAIVESYVIDGETWKQHQDEIPCLEFYEADELAGQLDNWCGPTVGCLMAMSRAAGFARVELLSVSHERAAIACYRQWAAQPEDTQVATPRIESVKNNIRRGINFRASRDEYLAWWFEANATDLRREDVRLMVHEFGVPTMYIHRAENGLWSASSRLPPGLEPGWYSCRISVRGSAWSEAARIAVDVHLHAEALAIEIVSDGKTWELGAVAFTSPPGYLSVWVRGLGENADDANTKLFLNGRAVAVDWVGPPDQDGLRQVNGLLPDDLTAGTYEVTVRFAGVVSPGTTVMIRRG